MISFPVIKLRKIKESLQNIFRLFAEHLFLTSLILILISLLLGLVVFYKYYIFPQRIEAELGQGPIKFQENIYQKILEEWQSRGERFEAAKTKLYPDPFKTAN